MMTSSMVCSCVIESGVNIDDGGGSNVSGGGGDDSSDKWRW